MYLDDLDQVLRGGVSALGEAPRQRQRRFVLELQRTDGGFAGRQGASDLYYTDFALRVLTLAGAGTQEERRALRRATDFVTHNANEGRVRDVVECFSALNAARMLVNGSPGGTAQGQPHLSRWGSPIAEKQESQRDDTYSIPPFQSILSSWRHSSGGFARRGGEGASAYATFLAALSFEMLGEPFPDSPAAVEAIQKLKRPDGGYADLADGPAGQTNATAAAVAFLTMSGALRQPDRTAVDFLCAMQDGDGGFRAWAGAPESDLLSTFTALVTLFAMDGMRHVDLKGVVRFAGALAGAEGGFRAAPSDGEADLEYTFYGLGALALIRAYVEIIKSFD